MRGQVASFPLGEKGIGHLTLNFGRLKKRFPKRGGGEKLVAYSGKLRGPGTNVVVGPSRAGKSTLVRMLAGVDYYSSGAVVDGQGQELCPEMLREILVTPSRSLGTVKV